MLTAALCFCDRETLTGDGGSATLRRVLPGCVGCGFAAKGQDLAAGKAGQGNNVPEAAIRLPAAVLLRNIRHDHELCPQRLREKRLFARAVFQFQRFSLGSGRHFLPRLPEGVDHLRVV